jgi:site-specific recombinase
VRNEIGELCQGVFVEHYKKKVEKEALHLIVSVSGGGKIIACEINPQRLCSF